MKTTNSRFFIVFSLLAFSIFSAQAAKKSAKHYNPIYLLNKLNQEMWELVFKLAEAENKTTSAEGRVVSSVDLDAGRSVQDTPQELHVKQPPSVAQVEPKKDGKKVMFADIAGLDNVISELLLIVEYLKNPQRFKAFGAKVPLGVLLEGPPGNGKTLIAQALANEAGCSFFYASGSSFVELYVGQGAARVREFFAKARQHKPAVIFIDEIDALGASREGSAGGGREYDQTLNQLLVEMQGFEAEDRVAVIAATNRADILDSALKRSGRFTKILRVGNPSQEARKELISLFINKLPAVEKGIEIDPFVEATEGFSGAEIEDFVNTAALCACQDSQAKAIGKKHMEKALEESLEKKRLRNGETRVIGRQVKLK